MAAVNFDTHKFVRKLKASGFNDSQAEALTDAIRESHESAEVATKRDIDDLRKEMKELSLRQIIWIGSIIFLVVNTGPILPKLLGLH